MNTGIDSLVPCLECGRPWGVILRRGVEPGDELAIRARSMMIDDLVDQWRCDEGDDAEFVVDLLPDVGAVRVVYLTEVSAAFAYEHLRCETIVGDCWQDAEYVDLPAWFLRGRKQRWAYRWDCCEIGRSSNYARAKVASS